MIGDGRYCMDVLAQTNSVVAALRSLEDQLMHQHLRTCVADTMLSGESAKKQEKIEEIQYRQGRFPQRPARG